MEKYVSCVFRGRIHTVRIAVLPHINLRNPNLIHNRTSKTHHKIFPWKSKEPQ